MSGKANYSAPSSEGPSHLQAGLVGFSDLFIRASRDAQKAGPNSAVAAKTGLLPKSNLLISGPPGAGKTTFALALVRSLMAEDIQRAQGPAANGNQPASCAKNLPLLYYINLENDPKRLGQMFSEMGWFDGEADSIFDLYNPSYDKRTVNVIFSHPQMDRPIPSSEDVVNSIFTKIRMELSPGENRPIYVIVDSLTALVQDTSDPAERRRRVHEVLYRLSKIFENTSGSNLRLSILLSEQRTDVQPQNWPPSVEEYLVDVVFRLNVKPLAMGRRLRSLEVVKSQGVNMVLGEHTWIICASQSYQQLVKEKHMRRAIQLQGLSCQNLPDSPLFRRIQNLVKGLAGQTKADDKELVAKLAEAYLHPAHLDVGSQTKALAKALKNELKLAEKEEKIQKDLSESYPAVKWGTAVIFPRFRSYVSPSRTH